MATDFGSFDIIETYSAIFKAKAVLPIEGLPAIIINSDGWSPAVILSSSVKPVLRPGTLFLSLNKFSSLLTTDGISSCGVAKSFIIFCFDTLNNALCALSNMVSEGKSSEKASVTILEPTFIICLKIDLSFTIFA